ncbi:YdcF family protein [Sporolactobacillus sp. THM7-7]|nr:YdcF family protein [Sporolactobacillus sp. THM7-7]
MEYIIKFMYSFILPPGLFCTLLVLLGFRLFRRYRPGALAAWCLSFLLYLFFIPITGILLVHPLEDRYQPPEQWDGDVIVMLGGGATRGTPDVNGKGNLSGNAANRLLTVLRLYNETNLPIILSGGQVYADSGTEADIAKRQLMSLGVPENKITAENKSITTRTNAENTKKLLATYHYKRPILVTSAFHMPRAVKNFEKIGVSVQPYPADYLTSRKIAIYPMQFAPSGGYAAFIAIKEYVGLLALSF